MIDWGAGVRHHALLRARVDRDARVRSVVVTPRRRRRARRAHGGLRRPGRRRPRARASTSPAATSTSSTGWCRATRRRNAYSNLLYKGAIQDRAHTVFYGNLVVPPGAPGTDAYQTNRNLVLNEGARADTIPFLEIETAEVKCSHAGAVGRVDDEHLFYLAVARRAAGRGQAADRDGLPPGGPRAW